MRNTTMHYMRTPIATGTGMKLDPAMWTVARLEEHRGRPIWFVQRQSTSSTHILDHYLELRRIWGPRAQIAIIKPNSMEN